MRNRSELTPIEIETSPPHPSLVEEAKRLTAESLAPLTEKQKLLDKLNLEYKKLMEAHVEALDHDPDLAEELIKKANQVVREILAVDEGTTDDVDDESRKLTQDHHSKAKTN